MCARAARAREGEDERARDGDDAGGDEGVGGGAAGRPPVPGDDDETRGRRCRRPGARSSTRARPGRCPRRGRTSRTSASCAGRRRPRARRPGALVHHGEGGVERCRPTRRRSAESAPYSTSSSPRGTRFGCSGAHHSPVASPEQATRVIADCERASRARWPPPSANAQAPMPKTRAPMKNADETRVDRNPFDQKVDRFDR